MKLAEFVTKIPRLSYRLALLGVAMVALTSCTLFFGKPKVGILLARADSGFMVSLVRGIQEANSKNAVNSFDISNVDCKSDQDFQLRSIDSLIQQNVKLLLVNLVTREGGTPAVAKAKAAGIPIIFFNLEPSPNDMDSYPKAYYVGSPPEMSGGLQGEIAADFWKNNPGMDKNKDGILQYVTLMGPVNHPDTEPRTIAFKSILEAEGISAHEIASAYANWSRLESKKYVIQWLLANPNKIEAIFANNDEMALGAIDALRELNYLTPEKKIPVIGIDGSNTGLQAVDNGSMLGTVYNDVMNQGLAIVELASALLRGERVRKTSVAPLSREDGSVSADGHYLLVPYAKVTQANYHEFLKE